MPTAWNQYLLAATEVPLPSCPTSQHIDPQARSCSARSPWEVSRPTVLTYFSEPFWWRMEPPLKSGFFSLLSNPHSLVLCAWTFQVFQVTQL